MNTPALPTIYREHPLGIASLEADELELQREPEPRSLNWRFGLAMCLNALVWFGAAVWIADGAQPIASFVSDLARFIGG